MVLVELDMRQIDQHAIMHWLDTHVGPVNESWQYWKHHGGRTLLLVLQFQQELDATYFKLCWSMG